MGQEYPNISMYCQYCVEHVLAKCDGGKTSCDKCKLTVSNRRGKQNLYGK